MIRVWSFRGCVINIELTALRIEMGPLPVGHKGAQDTDGASSCGSQCAQDRDGASS